MIFKHLLTRATHKIHTLPVLVMMPHSRCNCRCIMCDIWKANQNKQEISPEELQKHVSTFRQLGVREIVFSGGEALMHSNLWSLCKLLTDAKIKLTLLSTGLLLEKHAEDVVKNFDQVIISVDGSRDVHDGIRNVPNGYDKIAGGIARLRQIKPRMKITARCVLQRLNYFDFINIVTSARSIGLNQISFLAADVTTSAFNHGSAKEADWSSVALTADETVKFEQILNRSFSELRDEYASGFIAESPAKMKRIIEYYRALNNEGTFPRVVCNAPWVSAVLESNGDVMPCFFHKPYGNIYNEDFLEVVNSKEAINFRKDLDIGKDLVCQRCVCSLKLNLPDLL